MTTTAFAAENESVDKEDFSIEDVEVFVTYEEDDTNPTFSGKDVSGIMAARAITVQDLGANDSIGVRWTVSSEFSYRSTYNCKTYSEKFAVKLKAAEQSTSVALKCYNANAT